MRGFLLDTCVVSESTRPRPSPRVLAWLAARPAESLYLSVVTIGELEQGIAQAGLDTRALRLGKWLRDVVVPQFELRVLGVDFAVATRWGRLSGAARVAGKPLPLIDALLAATALEYELAIVTRNVADFDRMNVEMVNPWQ